MDCVCSAAVAAQLVMRLALLDLLPTMKLSGATDTVALKATALVRNGCDGEDTS